MKKIEPVYPIDPIERLNYRNRKEHYRLEIEDFKEMFEKIILH